MGRTYTKSVQRAEKKDRRPMAKAKYIRISTEEDFYTEYNDYIMSLKVVKDYREAVAILENLNKSSSEPILKVVKSAGANAENNLGMSTSNLFVAECYADQGPTLKRYMPKAHGRAGGLLKRTSHITVILDERI